MRRDSLIFTGIGGIVLVGILIYYGFIRFDTPKSKIETVQSSASEDEKLVVSDTVVGTGEEVKSGDTVVIHYKGTLRDGTKFDSSYDRGQPFETKIGVGAVIKGWDEGVVGMKVGGKRHLVILPSLGYGDQDMGTIPPNSTLIFDLELVEIKK